MEDTHEKSVFFSGRTTKGVGRVNPLTTKQKNTFFLKSGCFSPKIGKKKKKLSKSVSGHYKTKKKWHVPLSHWCWKGKTSVVRPLKKNFFFFPKRKVFLLLQFINECRNILIIVLKKIIIFLFLKYYFYKYWKNCQY